MKFSLKYIIIVKDGEFERHDYSLNLGKRCDKMKHNLRIIIPMTLMLFITVVIFDFYSRVAEDQLFFGVTEVQKEKSQLRHEITLQVDWKWINYRVRKKGKADLIVIDTNERWDWDLKKSSLKPHPELKTDPRLKGLQLRNPYIFQIKNEGAAEALTLQFGKDFPELSIEQFDAKVYYLHDSQSQLFPNTKLVNFIKTADVKVDYNNKHTLEDLKQQYLDSIHYVTVQNPVRIPLTKNLSNEIVQDLLESTLLDYPITEILHFSQLFEVQGMQAVMIDETGRYMKFEFDPQLYKINRPILYKMKNFIISRNNKSSVIESYKRKEIRKDQLGDDTVTWKYSGDFELWKQKQKIVIQKSVQDSIEIQKVLFKRIEQNTEPIVTVLYRTKNIYEYANRQYLKVIGFEAPFPVYYDSEVEENEVLPEDVYIGEVIKVQFVDMDGDNKKEMRVLRNTVDSNKQPVGYMNTYYTFEQSAFIRKAVILEGKDGDPSKIFAALYGNRKLSAKTIARRTDLTTAEVELILNELVLQGIVKRTEVKKGYVYSMNFNK